MKLAISVVAIATGLLLVVGTASAKVCTTEIESLEKTIASSDAGMGPTNTGATTTQPSTSAATATGETPKVPGTPATAAMNETAEGIAMSPEDVQRQNQGQPTAADAAKAGQTTPAAGPSPALMSLQRAKDLDKAGNEAECMTEVQKAKELLTTQ